jgi:dihydroorotate dehydrogenase electron transfer subunit
LIRAIGDVLASDPHRILLRVPDWPGHRPGQFAMLALNPHGVHRDPLLGRPMAVYRGDASALEFRFKVVGRGTQILSELPAGAEVGIVGPLGNGFPDPVDGTVLVGGGTGIASLYELASRAPRSVRVLLGGRTRAEVMGLEDFEALGVDLEVATEDGSWGHKGLVTELLRLERGQPLIACGPTAMMRVTAELAAREGAHCLVSLESPMACGFGICLGCAVPTRTGYRYVCTDGPVFDAREVCWDELE